MFQVLQASPNSSKCKNNLLGKNIKLKKERNKRLKDIYKIKRGNTAIQI